MTSRIKRVAGIGAALVMAALLSACHQHYRYGYPTPGLYGPPAHGHKFERRHGQGHGQPRHGHRHRSW